MGLNPIGRKKMEKQPKELNVTVQNVIKTKQTLKSLTPQQLINLWDNSKKDVPQETYQLIIDEVNRRLIEGE